LRIHAAAAFLAMVAGFRLGLSGGELAVLALTIAAVLVAEMFNTAVEALVDIVSPGFHPLAKVAKDVAAGGVLVTALASLVVAYVLFVPRLFW
jgi:Diacylglycerol kinase